MQALPIGAQAPSIDLPRVAGGRFILSDSLSRGPVVLVFFKISCPVCQFAFPYFDRLAQHLNGAGVTMVGISQDDELSTSDFMRHFGVNFPVLIENSRGYSISNAYGLTTVPTLFEVSSEGIITTSMVSWARDEVDALYAKYAPAGGPGPITIFSAEENVAAYRVG